MAFSDQAAVHHDDIFPTQFSCQTAVGLGDPQDPTKTLTITGCIFGWNSVEGGGEALGGAVVANGGVVNVHNTTFRKNRGEVHTEMLNVHSIPFRRKQCIHGTNMLLATIHPGGRFWLHVYGPRFECRRVLTYHEQLTLEQVS